VGLPHPISSRILAHLELGRAGAQWWQRHQGGTHSCEAKTSLSMFCRAFASAKSSGGKRHFPYCTLVRSTAKRCTAWPRHLDWALALAYTE